jgi:hypothetical protein
MFSWMPLSMSITGGRSLPSVHMTLVLSGIDGALDHDDATRA